MIAKTIYSLKVTIIYNKTILMMILTVLIVLVTSKYQLGIYKKRLRVIKDY